MNDVRDECALAKEVPRVSEKLYEEEDCFLFTR